VPPVSPASATRAGQNLTLDQYLDAHPVIGFLIAKGDAGCDEG
jgi:hypothetical protein